MQAEHSGALLRARGTDRALDLRVRAGEYISHICRSPGVLSK